jgi:hypothetical protein
LLISILRDSPTGTVEYKEKHQTTTNSIGLFNLGIGTGSPQTGSFSTINWAAGKKFAKVELSTDNVNFSLMGTQQLLSVPYALYSGLPWVTSGSNLYYTKGAAGIGTTSPINAALHLNSSNTASTYAHLRITGATPRIDLDYVGKTRWQLASLDNNHFALENKTASTKPLFITNSGRVGLSTQNPLTGLHVNNGGILISSGAAGESDRSIDFSTLHYDSEQYGLLGRFILNKAWTDELWFNAAEMAFHTYENAVPGYPGWIRYYYNKTNNITINMRSTSIGLGSTDPKAAIHITSGDVYLEDATKGVIMKSPDGGCWRMTVNNSGSPVFSRITCP